MGKDNTVSKPSTANREAVAARVYANGEPRIQEYYSLPEEHKKYARKVADQILALWPKVLNEEEIESVLKELRRNSGGKILRTKDIYKAISQETIDRIKGG